MNKTRILSLLLLLALLLTGCSLREAASALPDRLRELELPAFAEDLLDHLLSSDKPAADGSVSIYRLCTGDAASGGDLIQAETCILPEQNSSEIDAVLALFAAPSRDSSLVCALPTGVSIQSWSRENRAVTLDFSPELLAAPSMAQTMTAFCAALTLCELDGVESVTVSAGGQLLFSGLVPEDALLSDADTDPYVRQLRLYFADGQGRYLVSEYHTLTLDENTSPERYVVEELLRGPNSSKLQSSIPAGTRLLSCSTADGVCTVNLSGEFLENRPETALGERLAVYSVVNSLAALSHVDSVVLLTEGQPVGTYVLRSLESPMTWYEETIGLAGELPNGEFDADLYLVTPDMRSITPIPFRISDTTYASRAEATLAALLNAAEPGYPALFSGSGSVSNITLQGSFCTVDLSESFFASLPPEGRNAAVQSIAATLCALDEVAAVYFTIGGSPAMFEGTDWSGPWTDFDAIEVY